MGLMELPASGGPVRGRGVANGASTLQILRRRRMCKEDWKCLDGECPHNHSGDWVWSAILAWAIAQLGWIAGPAVMFLFSFVIYYTSALLADCYRSGDPDTGKRIYTYMDAV